MRADASDNASVGVPLLLNKISISAGTSPLDPIAIARLDRDRRRWQAHEESNHLAPLRLSALHQPLKRIDAIESVSPGL
jgi:hypothetical protein